MKAGLFLTLWEVTTHVNIGGVCTSLQAQQVVNRWGLNSELNYQVQKFYSFTKGDF